MPVWKREPVRVLSLFGDIRNGECSEVTPDRDGLPPGRSAGDPVCSGGWQEGKGTREQRELTPSELPTGQKMQEASMDARCHQAELRGPGFVQRAAVQARPCPWPPHTPDHPQGSLPLPLPKCPSLCRPAT